MNVRFRVLAVGALAAGVGVAWLLLAQQRRPVLAVVAAVAVGWSFVASGLLAWWQRPENLIGPVMVATGFARLAAEFMWAPQPVLFSLGHLVHPLHLAGVGYVLLAFPSGRLGTALNRWILGGAVVVVGPLQLGSVLIGSGDGPICAGCPANVFELTQNPGMARAVEGAQTGLGLLVVALTIAVLGRRWRRASPPLRFAIAPVLWAGLAAFAVLLLRLKNHGSALMDLLLAMVPVAFLVGLLRVRLARSAVADLIVELGRTPAADDLRAALGRVLHDRSLVLAYWLPEVGRYVDAGGRPVELPAADPGRAVTMVERDGRRIGALVHDVALREEPQLVASACAAAALALENERLQAELRARLQELQASRARLVQAADQERRRIERNLHDGTQQRLVSIAMALGLAQAKLAVDPAGAGAIFGEARQGLTAALKELRELSHGIHPGILTERGLGPALGELTLHAAVPVTLTVSVDRRLPEPVEATAYYVVCEALANVAKHAHATAAHVHIDATNTPAVVEVTDDGVGGAAGGRGSGLRGLADRVEAVGGRFWLSSPPGRGTVVRAELPCG